MGSLPGAPCTGCRRIAPPTHHITMISMNYATCTLTIIFTLAGALSRVAAESPAAKPSATSRQAEELITVTATVEAVDLEKRELTLKSPLGDTTTYIVDPAVKRLNEVKKGDRIHVDYYVSVAAEIRKPTPEEEKQPLTITDAGGKAEPGAAPAVGGLRTIKVVATVEGLDRPTQSVTVKGPRGNMLMVRVKDPAVLTGLALGEKVVITCTEAVAVSLEKAEKPKPPSTEERPGKSAKKKAS
jgi:Cu/Ag efflux protein CusF